MEARIVNTQPIRDLSKSARRALVECGLWLRIGFIGASGVAAGIIQLLGGEVKPLSALALAVGGGVLAALSWRRAAGRSRKRRQADGRSVRRSTAAIARWPVREASRRVRRDFAGHGASPPCASSGALGVPDLPQDIDQRRDAAGRSRGPPRRRARASS